MIALLNWRLILLGVAVAAAIGGVTWGVWAIRDSGRQAERLRQERAAAQAERDATRATIPLDRCPLGKWNRELGRCES